MNKGAPQPGSGTEAHVEKVPMPFKDQALGKYEKMPFYYVPHSCVRV